ncbi:MAG: LysR family transcriptional regulator, partial [Deltaproteobacteria bacterium]|nr:LysR family transcriptional regulator [Deltaproteobacteria bacterium]
MDIHQLRIFVAVYRDKSFTRAARRIHISQPTVSEHIKNLENELECRLFDRIGRGIEPTLSARKLFLDATQIIAEVARVKAELLGGEDTVKGEIILGASTIPGTYIIPPVIKRFRADYPDIFFRVRIEDSSKINQLILDNELVCGIVGAKMEAEALLYEPFFQDRLVLVAAPGFIDKRAVGSAELSGLPFVLREEGSGTRKAMEENFVRLGIKLDP